MNGSPQTSSTGKGAVEAERARRDACQLETNGVHMCPCAYAQMHNGGLFLVI